mmetsp:Transcript_114826/g.199737  ORF Transcript_114826/g.199737 Transcript_114826/m.199737 type:complete len:104 (-) Transcript_114826:890-1201(-)
MCQLPYTLSVLTHRPKITPSSTHQKYLKSHGSVYGIPLPLRLGSIAYLHGSGWHCKASCTSNVIGPFIWNACMHLHAAQPCLLPPSRGFESGMGRGSQIHLQG